MGNNISSNHSPTSSIKKVRGRRVSQASTRSQPINNENQPENVISKQLGKRPLTAIRSNQSMSKDLTTAAEEEISEKKRGKLPEALDHLDKLPASTDRAINYKRIKSQRNSRNSKLLTRERYSSTISASGFSSTIGDPLHFSMVGDSTITDITNVSNFSVNSFLDKIGEDNHYIMQTPDSDYLACQTQLPSIENVTTTDDILNLLMEYPNDTYDLLTAIYGADKMKNNLDLQREAFQAAETWSLRPTDHTAKTIVACCKLCGWGTCKNSKKGFQELQSLAKKGVWEAYYYLGQCYHYGVEQANEGYSLAGRPISTHIVQPIDKEQALYWYKKVIETVEDVQSVRVQYYVAEAQFRIAAINFASGNMSLANESINYLKESVAAGNRKSEFSLAFLTEAGVLQDGPTAKELYTKSAKKNYAPAQIQLALILLKDNSPEGISWLSNAAKLDDPRAYYHLGESYEFGRGVRSDPAMAVQYYQTAADKHNHTMSELRLGMHYLHGGLGLKQDFFKAFFYIERAAKGGLANAQYLLGMMYRDGKVPPSTTKSLNYLYSENSKHKKEAFYWIRKAAAQRLPTAITQIANCYEEGVGTAVNHSLATEYYDMATNIPGKHLASAQQTYACFLHKNGKYDKALEMYLYASGMKSNPLNTYPSSNAIARTSKRMVAIFYLDEKDKTTPYEPRIAFDILNSLANAPEGDADAHYWIAVCYEEGVPNVVKKDLQMAYQHYLTSANLGSSDSQFQIGNMLCKGLGVPEDRLEAFTWFQKSAEQKNAKALYYIGIYYYNGSGSISRDLDKARFYFKQAAELKNVDAMVSYAQICQEKLKEPTLSSTEKDTFSSESLKWYSKAAKLNSTVALRELGRMYACKGDFKMSAECYFKASNLNDPLSTLFLGGYYEKGQGVAMNKDTALKYYTKATELGHPTALFAIAELYENSNDYDKAYSYYKRISDDTKNLKSSKISRLKVALYSLNYDPNTFLYNQIPQKNIHSFESISGLLSQSEAFSILVNLANEEHIPEAFNWIAECYQDGKGVSQDLSQSLKWRCRASEEAGDINATMRLAYMYESGINGVNKNTYVSAQLYQLCADKNTILSR